MISREEAYKGISCDRSGVIFDENMENIDRIYDSIGSCGECKYLLKKGICRLHSVGAAADVVMMDDDFCSYFESKD